MTQPSTPDEVTAPWWDATREHRLILQYCAACGAVQHPPRALCIGCGSTSDLAWRDASGEATVDTLTTVVRAPARGFEAPYVLARVRLAEGPVLLTNIVGSTPEIGAPVKLTWRDLADGRALPIFTEEATSGMRCAPLWTAR
jgi:uncharacterized OB-fold protein